MTSRLRALATAVLIAAGGAAPAQQVRFPADPVPPKPPSPAPQPREPSAPQKLLKGQFYVVASAKPLLVIPTGGGAVTVAQRKGPLMIPAELAVGYAPDPKDPDFVTFTDEYLYVVKAAKTGTVDLQVIPALNAVDDKGKQVPLKAADIVVKKILVDDGTAPQPPPNSSQRQYHSRSTLPSKRSLRSGQRPDPPLYLLRDRLLSHSRNRGTSGRMFRLLPALRPAPLPFLAPEIHTANPLNKPLLILNTKTNRLYCS
jgi:hypothetical protein